MKKIILLISVFFLAITASAKTIYVATDGNNSNDGLTWDKAVSDLITAYSKASAGDQIWMAGGVYAFNQTINMIDQVDIYGGFEKGAASIDSRTRPNAENEPWKFTNETVLTIDMPATYRPIDRVDKDTPWKGATIDGITIKDIETTNGRVAYLNDGVTLQNCAVINCSSTNTHIYFERNCTARNCLFEKNYSQSGSNGVSLQLRGSKENEKGNNVINCVFRDNRCESLSIYNTGEKGTTPGKHSVSNSTFINNKEKCIILNEQAEREIEISGCLFEGNEAASVATTNAQGTIITGGSTGDCNIINCIVRNNKNTAASDSDWKNNLIYLSGGTVKMMNCLITNNSSNKLLIYSIGGIFNCTITNNKGSIYGTQYATFMNNAIIGNEATEGNKVIAMDSESSCYLVNNAINSSSDIAAGGELTEVRGTMETGASAFVSATTFAGAATNATQQKEINSADFSLSSGSPCINAGDTQELEAFVGSMYSTLFQKDLAGNNRFSADNKINIGAYQGTSLSGVGTETEDNIKIYNSKDGILISSPSGQLVNIYNITGAGIYSGRIEAGENFITVNAKGIYLVKAGKKTYKTVVQ